MSKLDEKKSMTGQGLGKRGVTPKRTEVVPPKVQTPENVVRMREYEARSYLPVQIYYNAPRRGMPRGSRNGAYITRGR